MLAPLLALMDRGPGTGVVVVLVTAAGAIASAWVLGWEVGGKAVAAAAALLLALSPAHVHLSRTVMSDVPASCLVGWVAVTAMAAKRHASAVAWAAVGLLTALAATVRPTTVLFLIGAGVVLLSCPRRMRSVAALGAGACMGAVPLLAWNAVTFGSPFSDGYHLWVHVKFFSLALLAPPVGGGTDPNIVHYAQALVGLGDLYPWPVAMLVALGLVEGVRRPGPTRTLCGLTLGFAVPLVILQTFFFWQDTRFLLPALPLLFVVAAVPFGNGEPTSVRVSALALGALSGGLLGLTAGTYPPPKIYREPATLSAIATRVEPNAAVLVRTNGAFFTRLVRQPGTDRLWVPLGLDEHQLATRALRLTPLAPAPGGTAWIDTSLAGPFDAATAETTVRRLLASGRPVYLSTLLANQVPFLSQLRTMLRDRFTLEPIGGAPWPLFRVRDR